MAQRSLTTSLFSNYYGRRNVFLNFIQNNFLVFLTSKRSFHLTMTQKIVNLADMRKPYNSEKEALIENLFTAKEPFSIFTEWLELACNTKEIEEPNAMVLSTANKLGRPSSRCVLLKGYSDEGFCFFTNYDSRKGKELADNPYASILFYWAPLHRQVRIEGPVKKLNMDIAEEYFHSRPRSSQISAVISKQSSVIKSREILVKKQDELEKLYMDPSQVIPKPSSWGGYRVTPDVIEFWQGQTTRLHDRIQFRHLNEGEVPNDIETFTGKNGWVYERLSP